LERQNERCPRRARIALASRYTPALTVKCIDLILLDGLRNGLEAFKALSARKVAEPKQTPVADSEIPAVAVTIGTFVDGASIADFISYDPPCVDVRRSSVRASLVLALAPCAFSSAGWRRRSPERT
jgi:hypothetical protein